MHRYTVANTLSAWDNNEFRPVHISPDIVNMTGSFYEGIRFKNGCVYAREDDCAYNRVKVRIQDKHFSIQLRNIGSNSDYKVRVNGVDYDVCLFNVGLVAGFYSSELTGVGHRLFIPVGLTIIFNLTVLMGGNPVFKARACVYECWALLLDDNYLIKALVLYDTINGSSIGVSRVLWSTDGMIYKYAMLNSCLVL